MLCKLFTLARVQGLQFTGMGGPMGVYDAYDTVRDNEGNYGDANAGFPGGGMPKCPPAFDCNGIPPKFWREEDGVSDGFW